MLAPGTTTLMAPIPRPHRNVFCVGRNYMDHVAEGDRTRGITNSELPKFPQFFTKAPDTVIAPDDWIPPHTGTTQWLDYEVELAVVIGTEGADLVTVDVQFAQDLVAVHDRHDDFRPGLDAAGQVSRIRIHIVDDDRRLLGGGRTTDATSERDARVR